MILEWFQIDEPWQVWLVLFGLFGQVTFFCRWLVQWIVSEIRGESHVPVTFWWLSLAGATMLFAYFLVDRDPVGMLGQSVGWVVYSRNLCLRRRRHGGN